MATSLLPAAIDQLPSAPAAAAIVDLLSPAAAVDHLPAAMIVVDPPPPARKTGPAPAAAAVAAITPAAAPTDKNGGRRKKVKVTDKALRAAHILAPRKSAGVASDLNEHGEILWETGDDGVCSKSIQTNSATHMSILLASLANRKQCNAVGILSTLLSRSDFRDIRKQVFEICMPCDIKAKVSIAEGAKLFLGNLKPPTGGNVAGDGQIAYDAVLQSVCAGVTPVTIISKELA